MTRYREGFPCPVAFDEQEVPDTLAEVLASAGVRQLHAAETEKYAHVTYFFNGGVEEPWPGEERVLVPSPRDVPSYDKKPEMSAAEVAAEVVSRIDIHVTEAPSRTRAVRRRVAIPFVNAPFGVSSTSIAMRLAWIPFT